MFWETFFTIILPFLLGIFLAIGCEMVGSWSGKLHDAKDFNEKSKATRKISFWTWLIAFTGAIIAMIPLGVLIYDMEENKIKDLENRIELLESAVNVDNMENTYEL